MDVRLCIQDPTHADTTYLYEAIIAATAGATAWRGVYAFASRNGVDRLLDDPAVHDFMHDGGEFDLLVGVDAVTNSVALERLQELEEAFHNFRPRVYWNETAGLFHPKLSDFTYRDGRRVLVIGSGNLTPGGLVGNYEAFTLIEAQPDEVLDFSELDAFFTRHRDEVRSIDAEVLERASRNVSRAVGRPGRSVTAGRPRTAKPAAAPRSTTSIQFDRVLIAQVPAAGGRWTQVHFNAHVIQEYFRISSYDAQRVFLTNVGNDGTRSELEVRPIVYSQINKNLKIEIGAAKGRRYPNAPPVLIFRERQLRAFDYMLLVPGDVGYGPAVRLTETLPRVGKGHPRVITDLNHLAQTWPDCPLLTSEPEEAQEV